MARLSALLVINQCNPEGFSEPLVGYNWYQGLRQRVDATLVTHIRNREPLQRAGVGERVVYIGESGATQRYYAAVRRLAVRGATINWPLLNALSYPIYAAFDHQVARRFAVRVRSREYDVVQALTPILPRYPVTLARACERTPFVLGPLNGGLPLPPGFGDMAKQEFRRYYFLRRLGRLLPGYAATYRRAAVVLAGSQYTLQWLRRSFPAIADRIRLLAENGVATEFFARARERRAIAGRFSLLFVGRLVALKGCDVVLEAMARVADRSVHLTIVGDGPQRAHLVELAGRLGLQPQVAFAGWVSHHQTVDYYRAADAFCFPSIREFGGAVVLEAMASGLPSIIMDHGGIDEYVTAEAGCKIHARSRAELISRVAGAIHDLASDAAAWRAMSRAAVQRAREFEWGRKCDELVQIYASLGVGRHSGPLTNPDRPPAASI